MSTKPIWSFLLVDPNIISGKSIASQLAYYGYTVHRENNGRDAINYLNSHKRSTDLILIDDKIDDIPAKKIAAVFNKLNPNIPIIILSAKKKTSSTKTVLPDGIIGYIKRPLRTDRLLSLIAKGLHLN